MYIHVLWDVRNIDLGVWRFFKARAKGAQKCDQKPRSREAEKPDRSREAVKYDTSREAEKPRSHLTSREATGAAGQAEKPRSHRSRRASWEAEKLPDKPRSQEAAGQAEKPRSHRKSWDSSPGTPSEHYVASSPSQDINSPTPPEQYVAPWDISPATPFEYMLHLRRSTQRPPLNTTLPR